MYLTKVNGNQAPLWGIEKERPIDWLSPSAIEAILKGMDVYDIAFRHDVSVETVTRYKNTKRINCTDCTTETVAALTHGHYTSVPARTATNGGISHEKNNKREDQTMNYFAYGYLSNLEVIAQLLGRVPRHTTGTIHSFECMLVKDEHVLENAVEASIQPKYKAYTVGRVYFDLTLEECNKIASYESEMVEREPRPLSVIVGDTTVPATTYVVPDLTKLSVQEYTWTKNHLSKMTA